MNIRPKLGPECLAAAMKASGNRLSKADIDAAWKRLNDRKRQLELAGDTATLGQKIAEFAQKEAERTRVAAAMQRRHAGLNILVRDRLDRAVADMMADGLSPQKAMLALLEGTQRGVRGGRNSIYAMRQSFEASYIGGIIGEIQAERPHLLRAMRDAKLDADIAVEMGELKPGGKPGVTKNPDAVFMARKFHAYAELARKDLNERGASIGKLEGWFGPQTHDDLKMIAAGKDRWMASILPKLDMERTFPDVGGPEEVKEILSGIYDAIVTGMSDAPSAASRGQRVNPANMAKSLGKSRVLHFADPQAALAYRDEFGHGTTVSGMFDHLRRAARMASAMEGLGPNPEIMLNGLIDSMERRIKASSLPDAEKAKQIASLKGGLGGGPIRHALDIATGLQARPVNVTVANIGSNIRSAQSMSKLGGALFSSVSDTVTAAAAAQFRGSGFTRSFFAQLNGLRRGRPKGEFAEISYLLGEGFDGIIGQISNPMAATDGPVGSMGSLTEKFFRWNGLSWWTDIQRATAGRIISAEMAMRARSAYGDLPPRYRHLLRMHAISEADWDAIRSVPGRSVEGKEYITPDLIRGLSDEAIEPLVTDRLDAIRGKKDFDERKAKIIATGRRQLELKLLGFVADETSYGVVEVDARSRRTSTLGQRPGTVSGEAIRFIMQFKGFPITFAQRVGGRALFGHRQGAGALEKVAHIGALLAGMTMAGYAALTMKDIARGYWPPRDISNPKTWSAAFIQGGAAGIYGDFLFSQVNRFGGGVAETTMGPGFGGAFDLADLFLRVAHGAANGENEARLADFLNFALQNTPFVNLYYVRPAMDYLFLNSLREVASPGYTRRTEGRRREDYGQERYMPEPLEAFE